MVPYQKGFDITPSASRLTRSLRDIGYDFSTALADLVDNSVSAGASRVDIVTTFAGADTTVVIADDGAGMTETVLTEALRFGSRRDYGASDLGRFGLGLKTASLSQCRSLTVVSRHARRYRRVHARWLDLDDIEQRDRWQVREPWDGDNAVTTAWEHLTDHTGTVVVWQKPDRLLPDDPTSGWARRRLDNLARGAASYLAMVFHRHLEGVAPGGTKLVITVNGEELRPWNPAAPGEDTRHLPPVEIELPAPAHGHADVVTFTPWVLPPRERFSSPAEWERMSGPSKWNRQQGLYVYRAGRLIQAGGWAGLRAVDEHTKLARAAIDFPTSLDQLFRVNVAKMRVAFPPELRPLLEGPVNDLCKHAGAIYRDTAGRATTDPRGLREVIDRYQASAFADIGVAIRAAAMEIGEEAALGRILGRARERNPELIERAGL